MSPNRTTAMIEAAADFDRAFELLAQLNSPVHMLADLADEADYLRSGDLSGLGTADGVEDRYVASSRASRRATVLRWINRFGPTQRDAPQVQAALTLIGGEAPQSPPRNLATSYNARHGLPHVAGDDHYGLT